MNESLHAPLIRLHIDQEVFMEPVQDGDVFEDATVATEVTSFERVADAYVLEGAMVFAGYIRRGAPEDDGHPHAFAAPGFAEPPVEHVHHRLPFILRVPVKHQPRGVVNVASRVAEWRLEVVGAGWARVAAELQITGLNGDHGYHFQCGAQELGDVFFRTDLDDGGDLPPDAAPRDVAVADATAPDLRPFPAASGAWGQETGDHAPAPFTVPFAAWPEMVRGGGDIRGDGDGNRGPQAEAGARGGDLAGTLDEPWQRAAEAVSHARQGHGFATRDLPPEAAAEPLPEPARDAGSGASEQRADTSAATRPGSPSAEAADVPRAAHDAPPAASDAAPAAAEPGVAAGGAAAWDGHALADLDRVFEGRSTAPADAPPVPERQGDAGSAPGVVEFEFEHQVVADEVDQPAAHQPSRPSEEFVASRSFTPEGFRATAGLAPVAPLPAAADGAAGSAASGGGEQGPAGAVADSPEQDMSGDVRTEQPAGLEPRLWSFVDFNEPERYYTLRFAVVMDEETLDAVADRVGCAKSELMRLNRLTSEEVRPGQTLLVPGGLQLVRW